MREFLSNEGVKRVAPDKVLILSYSVKTVANRHRHAALIITSNGDEFLRLSTLMT